MTVIAIARRRSDTPVSAHVAPSITEAQLFRLRSVMWLGYGAVSTTLMLETLQELDTALTYALCGGRGVRPNDPATEYLGTIFLELTVRHRQHISDAHACVTHLHEHVRDTSEPVVTLPDTAYPKFSALLLVSLDALFRLYWEHIEEERAQNSA